MDHPKPAALDPTGESFTFEKGAAKQSGGEGWPDVWKRGFFGWEYKGKQSGDIYFAESDRPWILDGAAVHVSMVGFDDGSESVRILNGAAVGEIHPDLSRSADVTRASRLRENLAVCFMGDTKGGPFEISEGRALELLVSPNPTGRPSSDVLVPWVNGLDLTRRNRRLWIIDFGTGSDYLKAAGYAAPFEHVTQAVEPVRKKSRTTISSWWLHERPRGELRAAVSSLNRYLATPRVTKHRLFLWLSHPTLPDSQVFAFAREDDFSLGVLHSRIHELWARRQGTQVRERESGFRYAPTTCFETFPFPDASAQHDAISAAARELDELRTRWLNPPEWARAELLEFPGSTTGPWARYVQDPDERGIGTVRWPRVVPKDDEAAASLRARTLTNLYNQRPAWLELAHERLDEAVFAAYGWPPDLPDDELLGRLLALNLRHAAGEEAN